MYADQIEAQGKRSIKDRLDRKSAAGFGGRSRPIISRKRQREDDDKWEHDLFEDNKPQIASRRVGPRDLRLKLQRKNSDQERGSISGGTRDLREKLSGVLRSRTIESKPLLVRQKPAPEASKPPRKSVIAQAPAPEIKSAGLPKKASQQKAEVDNFLKPLGLEKYSITFQAEEVDMTALVHMSDEDLKAMGIPMGPRKKILLALERWSED